MKLITLCTAIAVWAIALTQCYAQQDQKSINRMEFLEDSKTLIIEQEKYALRVQVGEINEKLENGEISCAKSCKIILQTDE